jgi:hypothetical protein
MDGTEDYHVEQDKSSSENEYHNFACMWNLDLKIIRHGY